MSPAFGFERIVIGLPTIGQRFTSLHSGRAVLYNQSILLTLTFLGLVGTSVQTLVVCASLISRSRYAGPAAYCNAGSERLSRYIH